MWAGTGLARIILPLVMEWMLHAYGFRTTLRAWAICLFLFTAPLLYFVRLQIPLGPKQCARKIDFTLLRTLTFGIHQAFCIVEALCFFLLSIYLHTFPRGIGVENNTLSALSVILFNVASVFGCVAMGSIVDKWHATTCILISTIGTTINVFVVWGFSKSLAPLYIFCLIYGFFAGSFTSAWPGIMRDVTKKSDTADPGTVFACLTAGRGVSNVVSGPLSEALINGFP